MKKVTKLNNFDKHTHAKIILTLTSFVLLINTANALTFNNEIKNWAIIFDKKSTQQYHLGITYKPDIYQKILQKRNFSLDIETIANLSFQNIKNDKKILSETTTDFYRAWIRFNAEQYEFRVGLQQINFGPAFLLRSLKWFDQLNPQDPSSETEGVNSLLFRYFFLNNANLWLWGMLGQNEIKGLETIPSEDNSTEVGGRFQYPIKFSETALSLHYRKLENLDYDSELRFGFDSRWDFFAGIWLETYLSRFESEESPAWSKMFTFGADYTIPSYNGIHILGEHQIGSFFNKEMFQINQDLKLSAVTLDYTIGFFSKIMTILSYDWISADWYRYFSYQMSFDYWSFFLSFLWNPPSGNIDFEKIYFDGKSLQLMVVVNF